MEQQRQATAIEEYDSLRQELYTIIQARYNILTANIALVAAAIGVVFTGTQPDLNPWLPIVFTSVLLPSLVMNHYLTVHFTRLAGYIYVRFEEESLDFVFERALEIFRRKDKSYKAYTWPILFTYLLLAMFSHAVAVFANWASLTQRTATSALLWFEILLTLLVLLFVIHRTVLARKSDTAYVKMWREALTELGVHKPEPDRMTEQLFVFVDRDGVINLNRNDHVKTFEEFHFLPGAIDALVKLHRTGFGIVVISNQPIIEEKRATVETVEGINRLLTNAVESAGGKVDKVYYCPHSEKNTTCNCRKPKPGMLRQASSDLGIDLNRSFLIGDQITDIEAGKSVGSFTILVRTGLGERWLAKKHEWKVQPDAIVCDLSEAVELVLTKVRH